jgi:hypothetical protein
VSKNKADIIRQNEDTIKYETNNTIYKFIFKNFFNNLRELLLKANPNNIFEYGCGNGYVTEFIKQTFTPQLFSR